MTPFDAGAVGADAEAGVFAGTEAGEVVTVSTVAVTADEAGAALVELAALDDTTDEDEAADVVTVAAAGC